MLCVCHVVSLLVFMGPQLSVKLVENSVTSPKVFWASVYSGGGFSFLHLQDNSENSKKLWYLLDFKKVYLLVRLNIHASLM